MQDQELELYSYELADGTKGQTAAHSVLEAHEQLHNVVSVQELPDNQDPVHQQAYMASS